MRIATRSMYGMGDCLQIGPDWCRDNATGAQVPCSSPACGPAAPGGAFSYEGALPAIDVGPISYATTQVPGIIGEVSVPVLETRLRDDMNMRTRMGIRADSVQPSEIGAILQATVQNYCYLYQGACPPQNQIAAIIAKLVEEYRAWYDSNIKEYYARVDRGSSEPVPGIGPRPADYVAPSSYVSGPAYQAQQDALTRNVPTVQTITPAPAGSALRPPTGQTPNVNQPYMGAGTSDLTNGTEPQTGGSNWMADNWPLLAAAAAALILLPNLAGGNR